jgi:hypothetical protein
MAENDADHVDFEEDADELFTAKLVRGEVHYLRDIRFDNGCEVVVAAHHKDHLEEHAVENVGDADGEIMVKDKFVFKPYDGSAEIGTVVSGVSTNRDNKDRDSEARMREFNDREELRRNKAAKQAPKFDKEEHVANVERTGRRSDANADAPPARPARVRPSRAAS